MEEWHYKQFKEWKDNVCETKVSIEGKQYRVRLLVVVHDPLPDGSKPVRVHVFGDPYHFSSVLALRQVVQGMIYYMQLDSSGAFISETIPQGGTVSIKIRANTVIATWKLEGDRLVSA